MRKKRAWYENHFNQHGVRVQCEESKQERFDTYSYELQMECREILEAKAEGREPRLAHGFDISKTEAMQKAYDRLLAREDTVCDQPSFVHTDEDSWAYDAPFPQAQQPSTSLLSVPQPAVLCREAL